MSSKKSTIIVAQETDKYSEKFQSALLLVSKVGSVEIVRCATMHEAIALCSKRNPASVWIDSNLPDFSIEMLSSHFKSYSSIPKSRLPEFFLLSEDRIGIDASAYSGPLEIISNLEIEAYKVRILKSIEVIKVKEQDAGTFSYSWSGKAAIGEKEANNRIFGDERFRRLVHNSLDLICVIEEDGFVKYVSESSDRILGYNAGYLSGLTIQNVFPEFALAAMQNFLRRASTRGSITNLVTRNAAGNAVTLELVCSDMRTDSVIRGFVISARDVTRKREVEEKIKFQARLLSNIREAVIGIDDKQRIVYLNPAAEKLYKAPLAISKGLHLNTLFSWEFGSQEEQSLFADFLRENGVWLGEAVQVTRSGRQIHAEISISNYSDQELSGSIIVVRDIKDRKVVENVLHESETRFKSLVDVTSDLVWQVDGAANLSFISPKVADLLGYSQSELIGKPFEILFWHSDKMPVDSSYHSFLKLLNSREPFTYLNFAFTDKNGNEKIFELSGLPIFKSGQIFQGYQGVVRDITQRVEAEKALRQSLAEKEILIKEIHHRVKNNMQIVSSLLFLQSQFIKDPEMLSKFQESQDRIKSMALVHEKLYQSTDLNRIDFRDYIESLTRHISNSYRNANVDLRIEMDEPNILMPIDTAIPCGLVLNELVSNAYKHAFSQGVRCMLRVCFSIVGSKGKLEVIDNGSGIPSTDIHSYEHTSLGMQLVLALTKQLRGTISVTNTEGSAFTVSFPV